MVRPPNSAHSLALLALSLFAACEEVETTGERVLAATAHARYAEALREAGLAETALGREWLGAAERALAAPVPASLPFREASYFPAEAPTAVAYRVRAPRGQRVSARVEVEGIEPARVFIDLFALPADTAASYHLASADSAATALEWEPRRDGEFLLRVQPELLRAGRLTVTIAAEPALAFPVEGRGAGAVQSFFGADRDGGQRSHHGVDMFAPRGTPVLAAAEGTVSRVRVTPRGGKVVWLRDHARGQSLYYAHLDSQLVANGARVRIGDTLGLVGNSGNARTTPPHLHFGIYRRGEGPVDPMPWIRGTRTRPASLTADTARLGGWTRVAAGELPLRAEPSEAAPSAGVLERHTALRILAASGAWYRVQLPDGRAGYVAARATESAASPLRSERLERSVAVLDRPSPGAAVIDTLPAGNSVPVLATFPGFLLVEAPGGRAGWLNTD